MPTTQWYLKPWFDFHNMQSPGISIQVDPSSVSGQTGVFGRVLILPYKLKEEEILPEEPLRLLSIEGWIGWNSGIDTAVQLPIPSQTVWPNQSSLRVPINDMQIGAIEETRKGSVVNLAIHLGGLASIGSSHGIMPVQNSSSQVLSIAREHWLAVLQQLGLGTRRLVELPVPRLPQNDQFWAECIRLLDEATLLYRNGGYEHALKNCRSIVEGIPQVLCSIWNLPQKDSGQSVEKWLLEIGGRLSNAWGKNDPTPAALQHLLTGGWKWLAGVPHYGTGIPLREDVTFVLGLCTDLLHFAAQAIQAHPDPTTSDRLE